MFLSLPIFILLFWVCLIDIIHLWVGPYSSKLCYVFKISNKLFKFLILLKEIIMIIKNYNKIALNITQMISTFKCIINIVFWYKFNFHNQNNYVLTQTKVRPKLWEGERLPAMGNLKIQHQTYWPKIEF